MEQAYWDSKEY